MSDLNHKQQDDKFINDCQIALKNQQFLSVTCNGVAAVLNRNRLGSGGKGKCIEYNDELLTPNEFQARCGKASSKDWKRSIRYHGRPISRLIDQKILACHAISCICAACSDDANVQSPIRYFKKWNRKRRAQNLPGNLADITQSNNLIDVSGQANNSVHYANAKYQAISTSLPSKFEDHPTAYLHNFNEMSSSNINRATNKKSTKIYGNGDGSNVGGNGAIGRSSPITCTDIIANCSNNNCSSSNKVYKTEKVLPEVTTTTSTSNPAAYPHPLSHLHNDIVNDIVNEQKCWWHLETVAENILRDAITLKTLVSHTKEVSMASKANILVQIRSAISSNTGSYATTIASHPPLSHSTNLLSAQSTSVVDESSRHDMLMRVMAMTKSMNGAAMISKHSEQCVASNNIQSRENMGLFDTARCAAAVATTGFSPSAASHHHIRYPSINLGNLQQHPCASSNATTSSSLSTSQLHQHSIVATAIGAFTPQPLSLARNELSSSTTAATNIQSLTTTNLQHIPIISPYSTAVSTLPVPGQSPTCNGIDATTSPQGIISIPYYIASAINNKSSALPTTITQNTENIEYFHHNGNSNNTTGSKIQSEISNETMPNIAGSSSAVSSTTAMQSPPSPSLSLLSKSSVLERVTTPSLPRQLVESPTTTISTTTSMSQRADSRCSSATTISTSSAVAMSTSNFDVEHEDEQHQKDENNNERCCSYVDDCSMKDDPDDDEEEYTNCCCDIVDVDNDDDKLIDCGNDRGDNSHTTANKEVLQLYENGKRVHACGGRAERRPRQKFSAISGINTLEDMANTDPNALPPRQEHKHKHFSASSKGSDKHYQHCNHSRRKQEQWLSECKKQRAKKA